jgi:hypothetical protein
VTTKIISTYVPAGYSLSGAYNTLEITPTGGVGGLGVTLNATARLINEAFVEASGTSNGVTAKAAATIFNGSADDQQVDIQGYSGVFAPDALATVSNFGAIRGRGQYGNGVFLVDGGSVTNGASGATAALIEGAQSAVTASAVAKITNFGTLSGEASDGVYLKAGGSVTNGSASDFRALIKGQDGIFCASGGATVVNLRTIAGQGTAGVGIQINGGGTVTNGAANDTNARIYGVQSGVYLQGLGKVANFGTIKAAKGEGVYLREGGSLTNGATADPRATIEGGAGGVDGAVGATKVSNFGTIEATTSGIGVSIQSGVITNGSTLAPGALIQGIDDGVVTANAGATVNNFGVIAATGGGSSAGIAVSLKAGGLINNGAANDTTAQLDGLGFGIYSGGLATIGNFGTISAINGLYLSGGATVTNGSAQDTTALIDAYAALTIKGAAGTVANFGTIVTYGTRTAVQLFNQGSVTNGSTTDTGALIDGDLCGVLIAGMAGTVINFGTIAADGASSGASGVYMTGGILTNGSVTDKAATLVGRYGAFFGAGAVETVTNFGTIHGFGGVALYFGMAGDVLNVEAGCAFQGSVTGGGGLLNLTSGVGTLSGIDSAGDVTVSGSMAATTFKAFGTLEISVGAKFTDSASVVIGADHTLLNAGDLTLSGALANSGALTASAGTLIVGGAVSGSGRVIIAKGVADFTGAFSEAVAFASGSTGVLQLAHAQTYTGTISGFSTTGANALDLGDIAYAKGTTLASFSGTASGGTLTITDGTHAAKIKLSGNYTTSTFTLSSDGHGGTIVVDPVTAPTSGPHHPSPLSFVAAMAGFGGGGGSMIAMEPERVELRRMLALSR